MLMMQEISVRLFEGAYSLQSRNEKRLLFFALLAVGVHLGLLIYLAVSKHFTPALVFVFLLNLLVPAYFFFRIWLDSKPKYRRHLTLHEEGVRYRSRFLEKESEFDWDEVDTVHIRLFKVIFVLKNEEVHEISLERIQNDTVLWQVKEQISEMVQRKEIVLQ
ncbi:hypothetical protein CLV24_10519 [Pontibacter ummariensis]|uniref:YcxB-like protein n=1 Tax=Pontibacter ummariensis TaxID=1610492 RepID=A0A239E277_9BACT|nr:hypothetical protein [Pontibacter ummariensis]PRY13649.1 hypothetical protein CLV24_10519 [Pontibacter ummariensis]SNS38378.1 hypothetical protein SAMN06296052_105232 [Pontibacter ummariensis]